MAISSDVPGRSLTANASAYFLWSFLMSDILKIRNNVINEIISNRIIASELLGEDIIIAGGFPLSLYYFYLLNKEEYLEISKKNILSNPVDNDKKSILKYKDVDIWRSKELDNKFINSLFDPSSNKYLKSIDKIYDKYPFYLRRNSCFANTFRLSSGKKSLEKEIEIQFISKTGTKECPLTPESLISSFDLNICKVAWKDGVLYVHSDAHNAIINQSLCISEGYYMPDVEDYSARLYKSSRYIKYGRRYDLEPSPELCEYIFKVFYESSDSDIYKNYTDDNNESFLSKLNSIFAVTPKKAAEDTTTFTASAYDEKAFKNKWMFKYVINDSNFAWLSSRKNYKKEWSLFLINNKNILSVKDTI
jgi:hypothetical protein